MTKHFLAAAVFLFAADNAPSHGALAESTNAEICKVNSDANEDFFTDYRGDAAHDCECRPDLGNPDEFEQICRSTELYCCTSSGLCHQDEQYYLETIMNRTVGSEGTFSTDLRKETACTKYTGSWTGEVCETFEYTFVEGQAASALSGCVMTINGIACQLCDICPEEQAATNYDCSNISPFDVPLSVMPSGSMETCYYADWDNCPEEWTVQQLTAQTLARNSGNTKIQSPAFAFPIQMIGMVLAFVL